MRLQVIAVRISAGVVFASAALWTGTVPAHADGLRISVRANATSHDYAGFELLKSQTPDASATTTFTAPQVTCTRTTSGIIVGSGVFSGPHTISASGVSVGCEGGVVGFAGLVVINGTVTTLPVSPHPGDQISTKVSVNPGTTQVTFTDATQNFTQTLTGPGANATEVANGIDAVRTPQVLPVPKLRKITFSATSINGRTIRAAGGVAVDRMDSAGHLQIHTGKLNGTGDGFTETFKHS
jgi:hypothetical protein